MAKYSFNEHVRSDGKKWAFAGIAIFLILAVLAWLIIAAAMNTNAICLFGHDYSEDNVCIRCGLDKSVEEEQPEVEHGGAVISDIESNGVTITSSKLLSSQYAEYGVSEQADSAYTLTAYVQPVYATNKEVDWTIAWNDASSDWANNKTVTDFVTVVPSSDGALTAVVTCLQDFGEQIIITVTSRDNTSATATCTIDYEQKITNVHCSLMGGTVDTTSLVGTWALNDPTTQEFGYAAAQYGDSSSNLYISMQYGSSLDIASDGFQYRAVQLTTNNNSVDGMWFWLTLGSPSFNLKFVDLYSSDIDKNFYLYIESVNSAPQNSSAYQTILHMFNLGMFRKVSDDVGIIANEPETVNKVIEYGEMYSVKLNVAYSAGTIEKTFGWNNSVSDIVLLSNFNELVGLDNEINAICSPQNYTPTFALHANPTSTVFDIDFLGVRLKMNDSYYIDYFTLTDQGNIVVSDVISNMQNVGTTQNVGYLYLRLVDGSGNVMFECKYYIAIDVSSFAIPVTDVTIYDSSLVF